MRILITGGAGFQGSTLASALLDLDHQVTIFNTYSHRGNWNIERFNLEKRGAKVVWGSITDIISLNAVFNLGRGEEDPIKYDLCYHLAAFIHVDESRQPNKELEYIKNNVEGTSNVRNLCFVNNIPMVYVSTCEIYGGCNRCGNYPELCSGALIDEYCPMKPQSPYAASKAGADVGCQAAIDTHKQRILIVRPGNIYGPGQRKGKRGAVIPIFTDHALKGKEIPVYGDGSACREFVYIDDLIRAYVHLGMLFTEGNLPSRIYNIGMGKDVSTLFLANKIHALCDSKAGIKYLPARPGEVSTFRLDSSRLTDLGFEFKVDIDEGLKRYVEWFKENEVKNV